MIRDERLRLASPLIACFACFLAWMVLNQAKGSAETVGPPDTTAAEFRTGTDPNPRGRTLTADLETAGFTYAPGTHPRNIALFESAVAGAHPEARRLIALVDGLTTIRFASLLPRIAGQARSDFSGRYEVQIDLFGITTRAGARALKIVVLHELGHVVDYALVSDALRDRLQAGQPPCPSADCQDAPEVFAEHFARWGTGDVGIDVPVGYDITAPVPLETWGAPLSALAPDR